MFDQLRLKLSSPSSITRSSPAVEDGAKPTIKQIYQSRQNFGVNFGSLFVLEKYIYGEMFDENTDVELDAIKKCVQSKGLEWTRKKLENHWNQYCTDDDWRWLKSKGVQSIRIPIGYWMVDGGRFAEGTSFGSVSGVYKNAWNIFIEKYIKKAAQYHISILVDLHALENGANTGQHSGENFSEPGFWKNLKSMDNACQLLQFIASAINQYDNISALQIVNEAPFDNDAKYQKKYYARAINCIREVNNSIPIIISDGWWPQQFADWVSEKGGAALGIVIDDHVYRSFSDEDKGKSADQLISELENTVVGGDAANKADFIVGEYSCVLDGKTWEKTQGNRSDKVKKFGNKEVELLKKRARAGYYFWCYKFQYGDGGEWGFKPMVDSGSIPTRDTNPRLPSDSDFRRYLNDLLKSHENYWNSQNPNEHYEHWRYKDGFTTAWNDSLEFSKMDNSRIGRINCWKTTRKDQHIRNKGDSQFIWEWEQGFDKALEIFETL
mgnify:FL=1